VTPPAALNLRPCVILALEFCGLDDASVKEGRLRRVIEVLDDSSSTVVSRLVERRLFIAGNRVLRVVPIKPNGTQLFWELLDFVHLQVDLIAHGVLLRGAATLGDAGVRSAFAVGSGVVEAERMRDALANVPRVIVDSRLILELELNADLRAKHHTVLDELGYAQSVLREDSDGLWFVDYLKAFQTEVDEPPMYLEFLEQHREFIERKLQIATTLDRTSRGFTWLRSYHNRVIDELFEEKRLDDAERSRLRIPATSPLVYAFPPSALKP
jgi:hypothetical protein